MHTSKFRGGGVLALLWAGIMEYVVRGGYRHLVGCASVPLADGGAHAARVYGILASHRAAPAEHRVTPRKPWPMPAAQERGDGALPALLKGYRKLGAYVCGAPAWDTDFNTADLFLMLPTRNIDARYARRWTRG